MKQNLTGLLGAMPDVSTGDHPAAAGAAAAADLRIAADRVLDITRETCPMTFVRTRLALDSLRPGQVLDVLLRGEEPRARVPQTAEDLGHRVLRRIEENDGVLRLRLLRGPGR